MLDLVLAFLGSLVAGYLGSMLGLVLGTLRLPLIVVAAGSPLAALPGAWLGARATGRLSEHVLRVALGIVLGTVGLAFAARALF